jgi:tRNA modification GTPase
MNTDHDPIVAIATASGRAGIAVVRVSGADLRALARQLCARTLTERHATHVSFVDAQGGVIDDGIAIFFAAPNSYTGEDVLELQGHGGPVVQQMLLARCLEAGAAQGLRVADPGEFTRRALLNDKLDLAQAEAVADLIDASTEVAVRAARTSLSGAFSQSIHALVDDLTELRALVEATLDFPEEEIDFLKHDDAHGRLASVTQALEVVLARSTQGSLLREGLTVVLAGRPNVGKSSLLNALAERDVAIVTPIAGTTRDKVTSTIQIEGIALHIVDTAGLRDTDELVERIGIERSWGEIAQADVILHLRDAREQGHGDDESIGARLPPGVPQRVVVNKIDLAGLAPHVEGQRIFISAKTGAGIDLLRRELLQIAGWHALPEGAFLARARHLSALRAAQAHLNAAAQHARRDDRALELFAEELRLAQGALATITGAFTADDLLGEIFGRFCIGK